MAFNDWSSTAGSNLTVGGVSIAEGMSPSGVNNAIRTVMAELTVIDKPFSTIQALRDNTTAISGRVTVVGYWANGDGGGGIFSPDPDDTTSTDNGGTVIVDATGMRWKRTSDGPALATIQMFGGKPDGTTPADDAIANLCTYAVAAGIPATIKGGPYLLTAAFEPPAGAHIRGMDDARLKGTDPAISALLRITNDNVTVEDLTVEGVSSGYEAGFLGTCVALVGCDGIDMLRVSTIYGKYGITVGDAENADLDDCVVTEPRNWGFTIGGGRRVRLNRCKVFGTTGSSASDCFKIVGVISGLSAQTTRGVWLNDCWGERSAGGQVLDVMCENDEPSDNTQIYINNINGRDCWSGGIEIKTGDTITTNYPVSGVYVNGGSYYGNATEEETGLYLSRRIDNVVITGYKVFDCMVGFRGGESSPGRRIRLVDCEAIRPRQIGFWWPWSGGGTIDNAIIRPRIVDAGYASSADTFTDNSITVDTCAIYFNNANNDCTLDSPTISRSAIWTGTSPKYGIKFSSTVGRVTVLGDLLVTGYSVCQVKIDGGTIQWPQRFRVELDVANSGSATQHTLRESHARRFVACGASVHYITEACNVARDLTFAARGSAGTTNLGVIATSASAAAWTRGATQFNEPIAVSSSDRPVLVVTQAAVTLPGSPTGTVIAELAGYYDGTLTT